MDGITVKAVEDIPAYDGEHAIPGIRFRMAAGALGVSAWGMNVLEFDAGCEGHPEHHHTADDHEELYVVLSGSIELRAHGESVVLRAGEMARVAPEVSRKLVTTDEPAVVLALGGTPGQAYSPSMGG